MSLEIITEQQPGIANFAEVTIDVAACQDYIATILPDGCELETGITIRSFEDTIAIHRGAGPLNTLKRVLGVPQMSTDTYNLGCARQVQKEDGTTVGVIDLHIGSMVIQGADLSRILRHEFQHIIDFEFGLPEHKAPALAQKEKDIKASSQEYSEHSAIDLSPSNTLDVITGIGGFAVALDVISHTDNFEMFPFRLIQALVYGGLVMATFELTYEKIWRGDAKKKMVTLEAGLLYLSNQYEIHAREAELNKGPELGVIQVHNLAQVPKPKVYKQAPTHYIDPAY